MSAMIFSCMLICFSLGPRDCSSVPCSKSSCSLKVRHRDGRLPVMPRGHIEKKPHAFSQVLRRLASSSFFHDHNEANSLTGTTRISSHWLNSVFIATQVRTERRHSLSDTWGSSGTKPNQTISGESSIAKRQRFPKAFASAKYVANPRDSYRDAMNESSSRQPVQLRKLI